MILEYGSHCVVYRPVFTSGFKEVPILTPGDMALDGPYFNHFLLNVICAHVSTIEGHIDPRRHGTPIPMSSSKDPIPTLPTARGHPH